MEKEPKFNQGNENIEGKIQLTEEMKKDTLEQAQLNMTNLMPGQLSTFEFTIVNQKNGKIFVEMKDVGGDTFIATLEESNYKKE